MNSATSSYQNYVSRGLVNLFPKTSTCYMGDVVCPLCGFAGVLRMDLRGKTTYYYITHYHRTGSNFSDHSSKYVGACYLGNKFKVGEI